jgi:hypothetical protein
MADKTFIVHTDTGESIIKAWRIKFQDPSEIGLHHLHGGQVLVARDVGYVELAVFLNATSFIDVTDTYQAQPSEPDPDISSPAEAEQPVTA